MNTKIKILISILLFGFFLIAGWLILNQISCKDICYGNKISLCKPVGFGHSNQFGTEVRGFFKTGVEKTSF